MLLEAGSLYSIVTRDTTLDYTLSAHTLRNECNVSEQ